MKIKKILNDPVYGFISIPGGIIFKLIEHPWVQRLRRIKQLGLTHYVYPGALHTRFHHAIGAMHLMSETIHVLLDKGADITIEEHEAALISILLHDIGHGPYSHALEHEIIDVHHEALTLAFMHALNDEFQGALNRAIQIFTGSYHKKFLHQLVSSQLDMDRMDYLKRDSFFTGVAEGVIGHDRIIKMISIQDDEIVVEEKGIYSIEKFLVARRLMYWQVYLHKTVVSAEQMLKKILQRLRRQFSQGYDFPIPEDLKYFLCKNFNETPDLNESDRLKMFAKLDDTDIEHTLKVLLNVEDPVLNYFAAGLLNRRLFKVMLTNAPPGTDYLESLHQEIVSTLGFNAHDAHDLVIHGVESNSAYLKDDTEIKVLLKSGEVKALSKVIDAELRMEERSKYYLCYPKNIQL
jgi:HD superfamily phosphohydrolase